MSGPAAACARPRRCQSAWSRRRTSLVTWHAQCAPSARTPPTDYILWLLSTAAQRRRRASACAVQRRVLLHVAPPPSGALPCAAPPPQRAACDWRSSGCRVRQSRSRLAPRWPPSPPCLAPGRRAPHVRLLLKRTTPPRWRRLPRYPSSYRPGLTVRAPPSADSRRPAFSCLTGELSVANSAQSMPPARKTRAACRARCSASPSAAPRTGGPRSASTTGGRRTA